MNNILLIGGDERMIYASEYFRKKGLESECLNYLTCSDKKTYFYSINSYNNIILPIPLTKDNKNIYGSITENGIIKISDLYSNISDNTTIFSSQNPDNCVFETENIINYSKNENFLLDNAYITAEGAIGHILSNTKSCLHSSRVLIIGWGRIAKFLYRILSTFTSDITVILRNKETIETLNNNGVFAKAFDELENACSESDIILNTVPARVMDNNIVDRININSYLYELASLPGGYDPEYAKAIGISSYILRGLPGICAPEAAGEALGKCIYEYICTGGETK